MFYVVICVTVCIFVCFLGSDDSARLHTSAAVSQCQERRPARHGPYTQLPQTSQPTSSLRPHERWPTARVCTCYLLRAF